MFGSNRQQAEQLYCVDPFSTNEDIRAVLLVFLGVGSQVLHQIQFGAFNWAVCLWVVRCWYVVFAVEPIQLGDSTGRKTAPHRSMNELP